MRRWIAIVSGVWAAAVVIDVALIRTHALNESYVPLSMIAGYIAGGAVLPIWYGWGGRVHLTVKAGTRSLTARTLSGPRTLDLNRLTKVRRFETINRTGGFIDELHLHDEHGVRLVVDGSSPSIDTAIRQAIESASSQSDRPTIKVTRHAQARLGLAPQPRLRQRVLYRAFGFVLLIAAMCGPGLGSLIVAAALTGPGL
ncbi:hypothetical protein [Streptomyces sp. ICBB 8177]|uniref:hypothetical protein n=1 Tax=Streptomyces sp. ICBB 8177 TaxID=563922 RepID=UPI000D67CAB2|nr:hypothetical protein [Streptomyces sp. ICBB 8177]PWI45022.1 hypothetical protein CK485_07555 [Streptomyces sp. ICBB 8177]